MDVVRAVRVLFHGSCWCLSCCTCLVVLALSCLLFLLFRRLEVRQLPPTNSGRQESVPSERVAARSTFAHVGSRGRGHPRRSPPGGLPGALPTSVRDDVPRLPRPFRRRWRRRRAATSLPANHGGDGAALTLTTQPQPHLSPSPSPLPSPSPSPG